MLDFERFQVLPTKLTKSKLASKNQGVHIIYNHRTGRKDRREGELFLIFLLGYREGN